MFNENLEDESVGIKNPSLIYWHLSRLLYVMCGRHAMHNGTFLFAAVFLLNLR